MAWCAGPAASSTTCRISSRHSLRWPDIVVVEDRQPFAAGVPSGEIAVEPGMLRRKEVPDAGIRIRPADLLGAVGRAIIPYDQFPIGKRLRENAVDRLLQKVLPIV